MTGLTNGTAYTFRLRAVNDSGNGAASDEVTVTPALPPPAKPTGFTATAGPGEVVLSWDDPKDTAIAGWEYNRRPAGGDFEADWTFILGSDAATTSYTVTGLEIGASYGFKVRAVNADDAGAESDEKTATLPPVPAKPEDLMAAAGDREAVLTWTPLGDPTVTGWRYSYKTSSEYGDWIGVPGSSADTAGYTVNGLAVGVSHTFRITAVNSSGQGAVSEEAAATPFAVPAKPTGFTATAGPGEVVLSWDDPKDTTIDGWEYKQRRKGGEFEADWTFILGSDAATTSYTISGLKNDVSYVFKVRAVADGQAGVESGEVLVTPRQLPAKPSGPVAEQGVNEVSLEWKALGDPSVTLWQYQFRTIGEFGEWVDIPGSHAGTTRHTITGLEGGTPHTFRVRAVNSSGTSSESEGITAVPLPSLARPIGLKAHAGYGQVVLTWDDPKNPIIARWQHVVRKRSDNTTQDVWIDITESDARTTRYVAEALEDRVEHVFRVRYCTSEDCRYPNYSPGSDPVSATPKAVATRAERTTVKAVLAGLAGHVAAGAEAVIGERFSAGPAESSVVLAGHELPLFAPVGGEPAPGRHDRERSRAVFGMDGRDALRNSAFQLSPGPPGEQGALQWSLWHRGDLMRFEGSAGVGSRYGGQLLSAWYGVDMRWDERWLAGTALARSKAEVDYAGGRSGLLKAVLDSVHPYLLRRFEDSGTAWITLGGGRGTIRNATAGRGGEIADAQLATASAGFRSPLPAFDGLRLSASGAAGFAQLETGGDARTAIGSLSAYTDRQSLGIEAALEERDATYYTSLSLRRDSGDGANGIGLEFTKGVEAALPSLSGHATVRTRGLVWNSDGEYREFGVAAAIRRPARPNGRGLSWSLSIARGTPDGAAGGPESFWRETVPERGGGEAASSLDLSAGWGFVSRGSAFTPRAAFGLADANDRKLTLGIDMEPLAGSRLKLGAERRIPRTSAPESRITAALEFRF